jgi:hypothetical protein
MKKIGTILAAVAVITLTWSGTPTWAATKAPTFHGYPLCISTTWASHHYGVPKTKKGATCIVKMVRDRSYVDIDPTAAAKIEVYIPAWYPSYWTLVSIVSTPDGTPIGELVRRTR